MNKKFKIVISPEAGRELLAHTSFMARVSKKAAERMINSFDTAIKSLENMPQRCPTLNHIYMPKNKYRYLLFEKRYMIVFQIVDDTVYVDKVLDGRQNYTALF